MNDPAKVTADYLHSVVNSSLSISIATIPELCCSPLCFRDASHIVWLNDYYKPPIVLCSNCAKHLSSVKTNLIVKDIHNYGSNYSS